MFNSSNLKNLLNTKDAGWYHRRMQRKHKANERRIQACTASGYQKHKQPAPRNIKVIADINATYSKWKLSAVIKKEPDPNSLSSIKQLHSCKRARAREIREKQQKHNKG